MTIQHRCSKCGKFFKSTKACGDHIRTVHKGKAEVRTVVHEQEESMADIFIEAEMNRAMGISNEDWVEDML